MEADRPSPPGLSFYTEPRFQGAALEVIADFCAAQRELLTRLGEDLRSGRVGRFGQDDPALRLIAAAIDRVRDHPDALQALATTAIEDPNTAATFQNVLANVIADSGYAQIARQRAGAPQSFEAKFDQKSSADFVDLGGDIADKVNDVVDALTAILGEQAGGIVTAVGRAVAAIIRDLAIQGKSAEKVSTNQIAKQVELKLDHLIPIAERLQRDQAILRSDVAHIRETIIRIDPEVQMIEYKVERLGDLLGRTLVGQPWHLRPRTQPNYVPEQSVKEELHGIEVRLGSDSPHGHGPGPRDGNGDGHNGNHNGDGHNGNHNGNGNGDGGNGPPPLYTPGALDPRLKKIYVYEEDVFTPQSANDERIVRVRTPAFDLSGWVDITNLRPGDWVELAVRVSLAGRPHVLFSHARFDRPGLKTLADFANGQNYLVGNDIEIVLRQPGSADVFSTAIEIPYQFVVESQ